MPLDASTIANSATSANAGTAAADSAGRRTVVSTAMPDTRGQFGDALLTPRADDRRTSPLDRAISSQRQRTVSLFNGAMFGDAQSLLGMSFPGSTIGSAGANDLNSSGGWWMSDGPNFQMSDSGWAGAASASKGGHSGSSVSGSAGSIEQGGASGGSFTPAGSGAPRSSTSSASSSAPASETPANANASAASDESQRQTHANGGSAGSLSGRADSAAHGDAGRGGHEDGGRSVDGERRGSDDRRRGESENITGHAVAASAARATTGGAESPGTAAAARSGAVVASSGSGPGGSGGGAGGAGDSAMGALRHTAGRDGASGRTTSFGRQLADARGEAGNTRGNDAGSANSVSRQVIRGMGSILGSRGGIMTIRLQPDDLGPLRVHLSTLDGRTSLRLLSDSPQAQQLLNSTVDQLRSALEQRGLQVDQISVQALTRGTATLALNAGQSQQSSHDQHSGGRQAQDDAEQNGRQQREGDEQRQDGGAGHGQSGDDARQSEQRGAAAGSPVGSGASAGGEGVGGLKIDDEGRWRPHSELADALRRRFRDRLDRSVEQQAARVEQRGQ